MSPPDYSSARLRPRRAGFRFIRWLHSTKGPIQHRSFAASDTRFLLLPRPADDSWLLAGGARFWYLQSASVAHEHQHRFTAGTDERWKLEDAWLVYRGQEG